MDELVTIQASEYERLRREAEEQRARAERAEERIAWLRTEGLSRTNAQWEADARVEKAHAEKAEAEAAELRKKLENETGTLQARLADANHWREINLSRASRAEAGRDAAIAAKEQAERSAENLDHEVKAYIVLHDGCVKERDELRQELEAGTHNYNVLYRRWKEVHAERENLRTALAAKDVALRAAEERCEDCNDVALRAMREADAFKMRGAELDACCRAAANLLHRLDVFCGPHPAWKAEMGALRSCLDAAIAQPERGVGEEKA